MTKSEKQALDIKQWCGQDFPISFDVVTKQNGETDYIEDWKGAKDWDALLSMCRRGANKRHGFRIEEITNYEASHKIIY